MAFDRKEMARNLKILDSTPKEIERQRQALREKLAEIDAEEKKGIWGKVTLDNRRKEARAEFDRTCHALANQMRPALEYVAANNNYGETETINFEDPKLQAALKTIDYMGKDLSYSDQLDILSRFRGDIGALKVLERAFSKNGLYMANAAKEMRKTIPENAIREMSEVLDFHEYGESRQRFDFPIERARWTKAEFGKQLERLSLDTTDAPDPYSAVLDAAADNIRSTYDEVQFSNADEADKVAAKARANAQLMKLEYAKREMQEAQARGENPASVLNRELAKIEVNAAASAGSVR